VIETDSNPLEGIANILICPGCGDGLKLGAEEVSCSGCQNRYPMYEGVAHLALLGGSDTWNEQAPAQDSTAYQKQYQDFADAERYNLKYERHLLKRLSTRREYQRLQELCGSQAHCTTMLELPCGGGRLSPQLAPSTDLLIEADIAMGQVLYGKSKEDIGVDRAWMTASAFHIPFRDESVDAVVCVRLCHHLPTHQERERLLRELLRVAGRYVVMTFFDYHSLKNRLRRLRGKSPKHTMTVEQVAELAASCNAELAACPQLFSIGSGHRYALMVKRGS